jgi:glycogen debranching enzyme
MPMNPFMPRRSFLAKASAVAIAGSFSNLLAQGSRKPLFVPPQEPVDREKLSALLDKLLVTDSPELHRFAVEAYASCILGKVHAPTPPLAHRWIAPGGSYYAQWLWDTMFVVDLLSLLPDQEELIRGAFQNYWDFQKRWDAEMPEFKRGMVACDIAPYDSPGDRDGKLWRTFPAYSQIPILAWGMERVYLRNGDKELLRAGLAPLESFHEWFWRERDLTGLGLVGVGSYDGVTQSARYEGFDHECDLDTLKMISHPGRPAGEQNGAWYGDIATPSNTAYLLRSEQSLARMAAIFGNHEMAARCLARYEKGAAAMREHMWDDDAGCFLAVRTTNLKKIPTPNLGSFIPLMAHVPTPKQAETMAATLLTPAWATALPIPSMPANLPEYSSGRYWRGDSWPAPNYQIATGLASYGNREAAARIADLSVSNALKHGISERYDSMSGAGLGVPGVGMSSTLLTMILDGLTSDRYRMHVRK